MFFQRLRSENRLLRKRVELLEKESSELADRLVKGQVSRAEEEETTFSVKRELALLQHAHLELSHQLEMAHDEIRNLSVLLEQTVRSNISSDKSFYVQNFNGHVNFPALFSTVIHE